MANYPAHEITPELTTLGLLARPRLRAALNRAIEWTNLPQFARILLAEPPFQTGDDIEVIAHAGKPLRERGYSKRNQPHFFLENWTRQRLHSIRFPYLACLLEGEMDWRIGITQKMATSLPEPDASCTYYTLRFKPGQFFLMPPRVPFSDGSRLHWQRPHPEKAHYKMVWIHILPTGTFCHLSGVVHGERYYNTPLYIHDPRSYLLSEFLQDELQTRADSFNEAAHDHLHTILLRTRRYLQEQAPFAIYGGAQKWRHESAQQDVKSILTDSTTAAVQRACTYIEAHLHEPLPAEMVARQAFVSPSHLNRLFVKELKRPVARYITKRRMEIAQSLLRHSQLPIHEIGRQVGYPNPSHFSQVFAREVQQSPQNYRSSPSLKTKESES